MVLEVNLYSSVFFLLCYFFGIIVYHLSALIFCNFQVLHYFRFLCLKYNFSYNPLNFIVICCKLPPFPSYFYYVGSFLPFFWYISLLKDCRSCLYLLGIILIWSYHPNLLIIQLVWIPILIFVVVVHSFACLLQLIWVLSIPLPPLFILEFFWFYWVWIFSFSLILIFHLFYDFECPPSSLGRTFLNIFLNPCLLVYFVFIKAGLYF